MVAFFVSKYTLKTTIDDKKVDYKWTTNFQPKFST